MMVFLKLNHGEGGSEHVRFRPLLENELLDLPVEQFFASLRFDQREKLDQLANENGSVNAEIASLK
jgi:hypothetical protein